MIRVYFETDSTSEEVATFESENHYMVCLPILKELARQDGWLRVTESVEEKVWHNNSAHLSTEETSNVIAKHTERIYANNITTIKWEGGVKRKDEDSKYRPNQT